MTFSHSYPASANRKTKNLNSANSTDHFLTMSSNKPFDFGDDLGGDTNLPPTSNDAISSDSASDSVVESKEGSTSELLKRLEDYCSAGGTDSDGDSVIFCNGVAKTVNVFNNDGLAEVLDEVWIDSIGIGTGDSICFNADDDHVPFKTGFICVNLDMEEKFYNSVPVFNTSSNDLSGEEYDLWDDVCIEPPNNVVLNLSEKGDDDDANYTPKVGVSIFSNETNSDVYKDNFDLSFNVTSLSESNNELVSEEPSIPKTLSPIEYFETNSYKHDNGELNDHVDGKVGFSSQNCKIDIEKIIAKYKSESKRKNFFRKLFSFTISRKTKTKSFDIQQKNSCIIKSENSKFTKPKRYLFGGVKKSAKSDMGKAHHSKLSGFWNSFLHKLSWRKNNDTKVWKTTGIPNKIRNDSISEECNSAASLLTAKAELEYFYDNNYRNNVTYSAINDDMAYNHYQYRNQENESFKTKEEKKNSKNM